MVAFWGKGKIVGTALFYHRMISDPNQSPSYILSDVLLRIILSPLLSYNEDTFRSLHRHFSNFYRYFTYIVYCKFSRMCKYVSGKKMCIHKTPNTFYHLIENSCFRKGVVFNYDRNRKGSKAFLRLRRLRSVWQCQEECYNSIKVVYIKGQKRTLPCRFFSYIPRGRACYTQHDPPEVPVRNVKKARFGVLSGGPFCEGKFMHKMNLFGIHWLTETSHFYIYIC